MISAGMQVNQVNHLAILIHMPLVQSSCSLPPLEGANGQMAGLLVEFIRTLSVDSPIADRIEFVCRTKVLGRVPD